MSDLKEYIKRIEDDNSRLAELCNKQAKYVPYWITTSNNNYLFICGNFTLAGLSKSVMQVDRNPSFVDSVGDYVDIVTYKATISINPKSISNYKFCADMTIDEMKATIEDYLYLCRNPESENIWKHI